MNIIRRPVVPHMALGMALALLATACSQPRVPDSTAVSPKAQPASFVMYTPAAANPPPAPDSAKPARTTTPAMDALGVDQLLAAGHAAITQHRLVAPQGDNAFAYFEAALRKDPGNPVASATLRDMFPYGVTTVEQTLTAHHYGEARQQIDLLAKADPDNYALTILRARLKDPAPVQASQPVQTGTGHTLTLTGTTGSWISVSSPAGKSLYSGLLGAGEQRSFNNTGPLAVVVGDAAGATAALDGKQLPLKPGYHSKVARFRVFQN